MKIKLYDIAHSRAGDKGNTLTLSLIPYKEEDFPLLCKLVTVDKVKKHLKEIAKGDIVRYELPAISSLLFVCQQALTGGVTTSLSLDTHGKSLSYALLEMEIEYSNSDNQKRIIKVIRMSILLDPVATVKNSRMAATDDFWGNVISEIILLDHMPTKAFENIELFSHLDVIYYFDRVDKTEIVYAGRPRR